MSNQAGSPQPYKGGGGINSHVVIGGVIAVLLIIFILQNTKSTSIHFLFFSFSAPLWLIILIVAVLAALLDGVVGRAYRKWRGKDDTSS